MSLSSEQKLEQAKSAINEMVGDDSVSQIETIEMLKEIIEDCRSWISSIKADIERDGG